MRFSRANGALNPAHMSVRRPLFQNSGRTAGGCRQDPADTHIRRPPSVTRRRPVRHSDDSSPAWKGLLSCFLLLNISEAFFRGVHVLLTIPHERIQGWPFDQERARSVLTLHMVCAVECGFALENRNFPRHVFHVCDVDTRIFRADHRSSSPEPPHKA